MGFIKDRLPIYNDKDVFDDFIKNGFYDVINYSDLGNDYVKSNFDFVMGLIKNGNYSICFNSPSYIKNNYLFYIASFEFGNLNPIFFFKGNIHDFDEFFDLHWELIDYRFFDNKFKLKKVIDFNSKITDIFFDSLNNGIVNDLEYFEFIRSCGFYDKIIKNLRFDVISKLYGEGVSLFVSKYGFDVILKNNYESINGLSLDELNRFFDVFGLRNGSINNLYNLYKALVDYNFVFKCQNDILNGNSFSFIKPNNMEYVILLIDEINKYLSYADKDVFLKKSGSIESLFDRYLNLFNSSNYKEFNLYGSLIRDICKLAYNRKRELFIFDKCDFSKGFPFDIDVSLKMRRIINKKHLMEKKSLEVAYDFDKLCLLKSYLIDKGLINDSFDTNVLFALLTDGVKGIKLIDLEGIDKNYLIGKINNYISSLIDDCLLDLPVNLDECYNLPLNDDCFCVSSNIREIVNGIDLKRFFDNVIRNDNVYGLFKKYVDSHDLLYFVSSLKLCDVCYNGDCSYCLSNLIMFVNNFDRMCFNNNRNVYTNFFDMLKLSSFVNNPLNKYEMVFGDVNKWIISNPRPHNSLVGPESRINECMDVYRKMLDRCFVSVPVYSLKIDGLTISNDNFYDYFMLVTGEKLGSCMRAGGAFDNLFKYTLLSPNGFNIIIKKDDNLISRIAGVCFGNTIFLNELRVDVNRKYGNNYLFDILKKYVNGLVNEASKYGHVIDQVYITYGVQGTKSIKDNVVINDMFWNLKNGKYGFNMGYSDRAICLYGKVSKVNFDSKYYLIPRFKVLSGDDAIKRVNMLRALYNDEWDYISKFDKCMCGSNWYVYSLNGCFYSYISCDNFSDNNLECFENAKSMINFKKSV